MTTTTTRELKTARKELGSKLDALLQKLTNAQVAGEREAVATINGWINDVRAEYEAIEAEINIRKVK